MPPKRTATGRVTKPVHNKKKLSSIPGMKKAITPTSSTMSAEKSKASNEATLSAASMSVNSIPGSSSSAGGAEQKKQAGPVYFWKPAMSNGYLGQWYWTPYTVDGETYKTAEMWMMVQKARLFEDEVVAKKMLATTDPKRHKALGREVKNFNQKTWDSHKTRVVTEGNMHKFTISEDADTLRYQLLATADRELVEASPLDRIWGVGFAEKNAGGNRHRWGQNLLGKILMDVRSRLKEETKKIQDE